MPRSDDLLSLPADLPVPVDDGGCDHLPGLEVPALELTSTRGERVDLARLPGRTVVYCYPRTGLPDRDPPAGWDRIPGARGCTPQSCGYRERFPLIRERRVRVFGLSTQTSEYQREVVARLGLPFPILSDAELQLTRALRLPVFEVESKVLLKRATLVLRDGRVEKVFYPVFPPDRDAEQVLAWLEANPIHAKPVIDRRPTAPERHWQRVEGPLLLTTDPARIEVAAVHAYLTRSYWAPGIALDTVRRSIQHSIPFALFHHKRQIGFARVVTDRNTFAYLADVFVLDEFRGKGYGRWMLEGVLSHPELQGLRTWLLATRDAHGLYAKHGFVPLPNPGRWMRRPAEPDHESARRMAREREGIAGS